MRGRYYHGSAGRRWEPLLKTHAAVLRSGETQITDAHVSPLSGRVYVTPNVSTAFSYMTFRQKWPNYVGAVMEVATPPISQVLVDEDCVGQALSLYYAIKSGEWSRAGGRYVNQDFVKSACQVHRGGWEVDRLAKHEGLLEELARQAELTVSKRELVPLRTGRGTIRVYAKVGKLVTRKLSAQLKKALIDQGANISIPSPSKVLGGWVFNGVPNIPGSGWVEKAFESAVYIPNQRGRRAPRLPWKADTRYWREYR
jgi:hypothetical protein